MAQLELRIEGGEVEVNRRVELPPTTRGEVVALMRAAMVSVLEDERGDDDEGAGQSQDRS